MTVPGIKYDALASNLASARNVLIGRMGELMVAAKGAHHCRRRDLILIPCCIEHVVNGHLDMAAIHGRQFAEAVSSLLMLKFVNGFQYLEDVTLSGDFNEPMPLATRIHVHLQGTKVPPSVINALEDLRVIGNQAMFMALTSVAVDQEKAEKLLLLLQFLGHYVIRGGSVGQQVALSARRDGTRGPPPAARGIYQHDPTREAEQQLQPVHTDELTQQLLTMEINDELEAEARLDKAQKSQDRTAPKAKVTVVRPAAAKKPSNSQPADSVDDSPKRTNHKSPQLKPTRSSQLRSKAIKEGLEIAQQYGPNTANVNRSQTDLKPGAAVQSLVKSTSPRKPKLSKTKRDRQSPAKTHATQTQLLSSSDFGVTKPLRISTTSHPSASLPAQPSLPGLASFDMRRTERASLDGRQRARQGPPKQRRHKEQTV
eukprot:TRINITY_DN5391_c0_g1_i1.p1 TRINITY_DN5391_c0_g1~~TRINITY_DN5391_c0_g1_i1.p1  ORF type:complete len:427 (+),score=83.57 TRINITY_DN5391_c0_g1_i1:155-1435(+)